MKLNFITKNKFKLATARFALEPLGFEVLSLELDIPEIQADTSREIARHSALTAAQTINEPVMREDHGFFLNAFPGWPGPYMAHTERNLFPEDLLRLIESKDSTGYFEISLAYAQSDGNVLEYSFQLPCKMAREVRPGGKDFGWDSIICLSNDQRAISEYPQKERYEQFARNFQELAKELTK
ncbi:MAG: non-canonical purine NTP pyrophosphatase [Patescibacteria group bacterium]